MLTVCGGGGMGSGEDGLRISSLSLESLGDGTDLVSDLGVFIDLRLKVLENSRIYHSRARSHAAGGGARGVLGSKG